MKLSQQYIYDGASGQVAVIDETGNKVVDTYADGDLSQKTVMVRPMSMGMW
jgi:hypothetical protein